MAWRQHRRGVGEEGALQLLARLGEDDGMLQPEQGDADQDSTSSCWPGGSVYRKRNESVRVPRAQCQCVVCVRVRAYIDAKTVLVEVICDASIRRH